MKLSRSLRAFISTLLLISLSTHVVAFASTTSVNQIPCSEIINLSDGGKIYKFIVNGFERLFPVPPDDFDPLTASTEALYTYGFPAKPTDSEELAEWTALMLNYSETPVPSLSFANKAPSAVQHLDSASVARSSTEAYANANWCGYAATGTSTEFVSVQGDFRVPSSLTPGYYPYGLSTWVGIGGANSGKLVQAGIASFTTTSYYAWYEFMGEDIIHPAETITSLSINPGDNLHIYVSYETANNRWQYYIANNTTGQSHAAYISAPSADYYDGSTVEWIVERPLMYNTNVSESYFPQLPNFGTITFTNCQAYKRSGVWYGLSILPYQAFTMEALTADTVLAEPGTLTSNSFSVMWRAFGPGYDWYDPNE